MASTLTDTQTVGPITISMYERWQNCGGGYDIVARNGHEIERIHTRSLPIANEAFAMLVGKYSEQRQQASETMYAFAMQQARNDYEERSDLYAWASGR